MSCTHCHGEFVAGKDQVGNAPPPPEHRQQAAVGAVVELPVEPTALAAVQ
jgi:hypothetical protein